MVVDNNKHCRIKKRKKNNKIPYGSLSLQGLSEEERDTKADDRNDHHEDAICIFSDNVFQWEDSGLKIETPENASNIRKWQYLGHPIGMPLAESLSSQFLITFGCGQSRHVYTAKEIINEAFERIVRICVKYHKNTIYYLMDHLNSKFDTGIFDGPVGADIIYHITSKIKTLPRIVRLARRLSALRAQ